MKIFFAIIFSAYFYVLLLILLSNLPLLHVCMKLQPLTILIFN